MKSLISLWWWWGALEEGESVLVGVRTLVVDEGTVLMGQSGLDGIFITL